MLATSEYVINCPDATHVTFEHRLHMSFAEENDHYPRHVIDFGAALQASPAL